jgi:hypothetical protein
LNLEKRKGGERKKKEESKEMRVIINGSQTTQGKEIEL